MTFAPGISTPLRSVRGHATLSIETRRSRLLPFRVEPHLAKMLPHLVGQGPIQLFELFPQALREYQAESRGPLAESFDLLRLPGQARHEAKSLRQAAQLFFLRRAHAVRRQRQP